MDLRILEIASHTENNKILENFTHKSKNKNPLCGDVMEISLIVKNDVTVSYTHPSPRDQRGSRMPSSA